MVGGPPARLPRAYFAAAFASLTAACVLLALQAERVAPSFLHHDTLALVHLVTLGWLTCTILGAAYIALPMVLQAPLAVGRGDAIACVLVLVAGSGVVSHFWIGGYRGVAWSGLLLVPVLGWIAARMLRALARSPAPAAMRAHVACALGNLVLAAALGAAVAADRGHAFFRGHQAALYAHAHLAGGGFVAMTFVGMAYRMLPMLLPAAPPDGPGPWLSLAAMQVGVLGLAGALLVHPPAAPPFAAVLAAGLLVFFREVAGMLRRRKPAPPANPRPDPARLLVLAALAQLLAAVALGLLLAVGALTHPGWRAAYGVAALVGGFGQAALGMGMRLLPWNAWMRAFRLGDGALPRPPHAMPVRFLEWVAACCWTPGAPALAAGMGLGEPGLVRIAAAVLAAGTVAAAASAWRVARGVPRPGGVTAGPGVAAGRCRSPTPSSGSSPRRRSSG